MLEVIILVILFGVASIIIAGAGFYLYRREKKKKETETSSPGPLPASSASGGGGLQDGGKCPGEWKKGGVLTFYDVNHPKDGNGSVAGLDFKPVPSMYQKENVVSVVKRDWGRDKFRQVDLRFNKTPEAFQDVKLNQVPVFTAKVIDYCDDKDCGGTTTGCCSSNLSFAKKFAGVESSKAMLFDVEQQTLKRAVGSTLWPFAEEAGVMNVEYKICDPVSKNTFNKYKK